LELGIDDPEKWLANAPKRVIRTWDAYWQLEPWGQPWHRHAASMMMLAAIHRMLMTGEQKHKPASFADWMPAGWSEDPAPEQAGDVIENLDNFVRAVSR